VLAVVIVFSDELVERAERADRVTFALALMIAIFISVTRFFTADTHALGTTGIFRPFFSIEISNTVDDTERWVATFVRWAFIASGFFDDFFDLAVFALIGWTFTLEDWTTVFFVCSRAEELTAFVASWLWTRFANGGFTSALVDSFYEHFTWSAERDLDSRTWTFNAFFNGWATAFGVFNKRFSAFELTFVAVGVWDLWTLGLIFISAALAWENFVCRTAEFVLLVWFGGLQVFAFADSRWSSAFVSAILALIRFVSNSVAAERHAMVDCGCPFFRWFTDLKFFIVAVRELRSWRLRCWLSCSRLSSGLNIAASWLTFIISYEDQLLVFTAYWVGCWSALALEQWA
jgi:hypothetical protein